LRRIHRRLGDAIRAFTTSAQRIIEAVLSAARHFVTVKLAPSMTTNLAFSDRPTFPLMSAVITQPSEPNNSTA
jgi:hypothetical protein